MSHTASLLASNVKRLRTDRGLTQQGLVEKAACTSIPMIEAGHIASPRIETLEAIAAALGVTVSDLFAEQPPERPRRRRRRTVEGEG